MTSIKLAGAALTIGLLLALGAATALADGGKGVAVSPLTPKPGDSVTVKGDLLGPNSTVDVRIAGLGVDIDLGEAQTDATGDFSAQFTLPDTLTSGVYAVTATGAESASTPVTVLGGGAAERGTMQPSPVLRSRPLSEVIPLIALFGALAGLGIFFAQFRRRPHAGRTS